jgi:hypothetical protein
VDAAAGSRAVVGVLLLLLLLLGVMRLRCSLRLAVCSTGGPGVLKPVVRCDDADTATGATGATGAGCGTHSSWRETETYAAALPLPAPAPVGVALLAGVKHAADDFWKALRVEGAHTNMPDRVIAGAGDCNDATLFIWYEGCKFSVFFRV